MPGLGRIDACELDSNCIPAMQANVDFNGDHLSQIIRPIHDDARHLLLTSEGLYDVVDLDPYGSPHQFLDLAVGALSEGGLLMATATDMAVLCGNQPGASFCKYGSVPIHRPYQHEQALRILLHAIDCAAARQKRIIVPLLSMSIDFYVRVFVRVYTNPKEAG